MKGLSRSSCRGKSFNYQINLTNRRGNVTGNINLIESFPNGFDFQGSNPQGELQKGGKKLVVSVGRLNPGESKSVVISGMTTKLNCVNDLCSTLVINPPEACINVKVLEPKLKITKRAPSSVIICDSIPLEMIVTNTGNAVAKNVKIVDKLPNGWTSEVGQVFSLELGDIAPGQEITRTVNIRSEKTGNFDNSAVVISGGIEAVSNTTRTFVGQPVLTISKVGRVEQYLDRFAEYEIIVTNKGSMEAKNLVVTDNIPVGAIDIKATPPAKLVDSKLVWKVDSLGIGKSKKFIVTYVINKEGSFVNRASAEAYCADKVNAEAATLWKGIPAILLELIDLVDPVEVGKTTTYQITVTNQGSMTDTNIMVKCLFEDTVSYVASSGGKVSGNQIVFAPFSLAPKAKKTENRKSVRITSRRKRLPPSLFEFLPTSEDLFGQLGPNRQRRKTTHHFLHKPKSSRAHCSCLHRQQRLPATTLLAWTMETVVLCVLLLRR